MKLIAELIYRPRRISVLGKKIEMNSMDVM